jgi:hypothetical protein
MKFHEFLKTLRTKHGCTSARGLFETLGGEKKTGMTLRNFQLIECGSQAPSVAAFMGIFRQLDSADYKDAITSFFETAGDTSSSPAASKRITEYLETHLTPAFSKTEKSVFDGDKPVMFYSEDQLRFLSDNAEALRLHLHMLLWERADKARLAGHEHVAQQLVDKDLADNKDDVIVPKRQLFKIPQYSNSAPSTARKGTKLVLKMLETFISEDGSPDQEVCLAMQLVTPTAAKQIQSEQLKFKKWVQSMSSDRAGDDLVPYCYIGFGKKLDRREL